MNMMTQRKFKPSQTDKENADPTFEHNKTTHPVDTMTPMKLPEFKF